MWDELSLLTRKSSVFDPALAPHELCASAGHGAGGEVHDQQIVPAAADSDCDGMDGTAAEIEDWYPDADGDGFGNPYVNPEADCVVVAVRLVAALPGQAVPRGGRLRGPPVSARRC